MQAGCVSKVLSENQVSIDRNGFNFPERNLPENAVKSGLRLLSRKHGVLINKSFDSP